ncbi:CLUMA_CG008112, isoform A [Clunio marinus]|uniref:CLUMA_CG008112, isoform A n=1 Tax=Clunio marinus TaxID=568069 RepID=A0A1J1I4U0_9DIPT|nr:CLUMA_CG008112, isoform A [Clunio marinus]
MAPNILDPENKKPDDIKQDDSILRSRIDNAKESHHDRTQPNHSIKNLTTTEESQSKVESIEFQPQIRWPDLFAQLFIHVGSLYGLYYLVALKPKFYTYIWFVALIYASGIGITAGAHRLWSHKSFKAKWPLRVILVFLFTIAGQRDAYTWAHDHRIHHKYSETNSDPHNAKRGFFFAHIGWLFLTPHPDVVEKRKNIDMSDLQADKIVMWQKKYYIPLFAFIAIGFPVIVPYYYWNECLWISFWTCFVCRFCTTLNIAFFVNSVAHMYGDRPYDKNISPVENIFVSIAAMGEGFHNYHHVFPWDYKTGEFGGWKGYQTNITTAFIDFFAKYGWAYERKYATDDMIARRAAKTGDGTYFLTHDEAHKTSIWGLDDKDIEDEDLKILRKMNDQENPTTSQNVEGEKKKSADSKREASWPSVLFFIHLNILGLYGIIVLFTQAKLITIAFSFILTLMGIYGSTVGAHRLWTHNTFKANRILRFLLMISQTMAGQGSIYDWVRIHRLHHQTFKTQDDPFYSDKDFLHAQVFAHIRKLSPRQEKLLEAVNMKDVEEDGFVMFQKRFYWILYLVLFVLLPINAPLEYWDDTVQAAIFVAFSLRYIIVINIAWLINSAHFIWGLNKDQKQSDSNMVFLVTKSYWPQYHYLLPFDYQSGEFGNYGQGTSTALIRIFAAIGWATDLKTVTTEAVKIGLSKAIVHCEEPPLSRVFIRLFNSNSENEEQVKAFAELKKYFNPEGRIKFFEDDCATSQNKYCHINKEQKSLPYVMKDGNSGELLKVYSGPQDFKSLKDFCVIHLDKEYRKIEFTVPLLSADNFEESIKSGTCFVDFYAEWCIHCREIKSTLNLLHEHYQDHKEIHVFRVNCWAEKKSLLCSKYNVVGFPSMLLFKNGKYIREYVDDRSLNDLIDFLDSSLTEEGMKRRKQYERSQRLKRKAARKARKEAEAKAKAEAEKNAAAQGKPAPQHVETEEHEKRCFEKDEHGLCLVQV